MTRPLSEHSTPRTLANHGYRIRQLERRPGPRSSELPYADMYWHFPSGETIPDSTVVNFADIATADAAFTTDATVFTYDLANGSIGWDDTTQHGAPALAKALVVWDSAFTPGPRQVSIATDAAYHIGFESANTNELNIIGTNAPMRDNQEVDTFFFLGRTSEESEGFIGGSIYQETGSSQDVLWLALSIIRLSPLQVFEDVDPDETYFP